MLDPSVGVLPRLSCTFRRERKGQLIEGYNTWTKVEKRFLQLGNLLFESKVDEERCGVSPGGGLVGGWKVASRLRLGIDSIQCWTAIGVDGVGGVGVRCVEGGVGRMFS